MAKKKQLLVISVALLLAAVMQSTPASGSSTQTHWNFYCAGENFTLGSPYGRRLATLTAVLPGRVSSSPLLFNSSQAAAGSGGEATVVYAVAGCQLDTPTPACDRCVRGGFEDARQLCGFAHGAFVFRDVCTVAYHNERLNLFPQKPSIHRTATAAERSDIAIEGREFEGAVADLAMAVAQRTVTSPRYFATGEMPVQTSDYMLKLYALAQCAPNLTSEECQVCLAQLLDLLFLSGDQTAWRAATVWCLFRYAPHPLFSGQPTVSLPAAGTSGHAGKKKHTLAWILGSLGTAAVIAIVIIAIVLWCRKKRLSRKKELSAEKGKELELKDLEGEEAPRRDDSGQFKMCPSAVESFNDIIQQANKKEITLFLDYDGTLSPIVSDPATAYMSNEMRAVLQKAAFLFNTSIVSGRARDKVFDFVKIKDINYAGSHGMDIKVASSTTESASASGKEIVEDSYQPAKEHLAVINQVFNTLQTATRDIAGANVEHNVFCVSLHYRNVASEDMPRIQHVVDEVLEEVKDAAMLTFGHMVYEFRPPVDWNKGHAVLYLLRELGLQDSFPIYIGDDVTDEDAFKVLRERNTGVGILVSERISRKTSAFFSLKDPSQVMDFLNLLVSWKLETGNGGQ